MVRRAVSASNPDVSKPLSKLGVCNSLRDQNETFSQQLPDRPCTGWTETTSDIMRAREIPVLGRKEPAGNQETIADGESQHLY
jgi:hypothetical protein